jgi:hypothetical protein
MEDLRTRVMCCSRGASMKRTAQLVAIRLIHRSGGTFRYAQKEDSMGMTGKAFRRWQKKQRRVARKEAGS